MSTPKKARALVPRVRVTEHTINLVCPAKVTEHTINLAACYVPVVTPEKGKALARRHSGEIEARKENP